MAISLVPPIKCYFHIQKNVRAYCHNHTKLLSVIHYLFGEQGLLFFRRERTQRRHLTIGGLKPVRTLIAFPFTTDKEPCLNCWEVHRGAAGLHWEGENNRKWIKREFCSWTTYMCGAF